MAAAEAAADSSGPRFAPDDPTLPAPWKGLIDGSTLYYWNPDTNVTQYERSAAATPPVPAGPPPTTSTPMPASAPGPFSQPSMQFGQFGQLSQQERPGQTVYPQVSQLGQQQQQPQQPAQQLPFQHVAQHQAPFQRAQQVPCQQQQQMPNQEVSQQPPAPQYPNAHPQPMPYQHGPYMQPQQQQQQGPQYSYQVGQQPQMLQTAYNQGQQLPIPQAAYNQGQQPPVPQAAYNQGQQPPMPQATYNQGQQPQMPHAAYNQGQQLQGMRIPQSQVQHPQQSPGFDQPAQASQVLQASQSQGLQMPSQQGQLQHGSQFTLQHGKQSHHCHIGAQLSQVSHGQQSSTLKIDEVGGHEGKQTGFSLPLSQQCGQAPLSNQQLTSNHQLPGAHNQLNIPGVGGPSYPGKHHLDGSSPGETNNMSFLSSPAQMHQGGVDKNYRQQPASDHAVPNHIGPSPVRPSMGFKMGNSEDHFERNDLHSAGRFDGTNALQQQPKLAALSPSQNRLGENVPPPFMTFEATGFPPEILREIITCG